MFREYLFVLLLPAHCLIPQIEHKKFHLTLLYKSKNKILKNNTNKWDKKYSKSPRIIPENQAH